MQEKGRRPVTIRDPMVPMQDAARIGMLGTCVLFVCLFGGGYLSVWEFG